MTQLINAIIQPRNYEVIRDVIGTIIAVELHNQIKLSRNEILESSIYIERFTSYDVAEGNVIIVSIDKAMFDNQTVIHQRSTINYNIDIYCSSTQDYVKTGDNKVGVLLHKLTGLVHSILQNENYIKLGLPNGIIENRTVSKIEFFLPDDDSRGFNRIGRITLSVTSNEHFIQGSGTLLKYLDTTVNLQETEQGYKFNIE